MATIVEKSVTSGDAVPRRGAGGRGEARGRVLLAGAVLLAALGGRIAYDRASGVASGGIPTAIPLRQLDLEIPGWSVEPEILDPQVERRAGVADYVSSHHWNGRDRVWFYVGYYDGTVFEAIHQPEICFPGAGWEIVSRRPHEVPAGGLGAVPANLVEFHKDRSVRLTLYTFFHDGRFVSDQGAVERGRVFGRRNFAIVTISTVVSTTAQESLETLDGILARLLPRVVEHLPAAAPAGAGGRGEGNGSSTSPGVRHR